MEVPGALRDANFEVGTRDSGVDSPGQPP